MGAYTINLLGLSNKVHHFEFEMDAAFFKNRNQIIETGNLQAEVDLDKHETFISATFRIKGEVTLTCDRSLDLFEHPIKTKNTILFKYGERTEELTDDVIVLERELAQLDLGQYLYEFIVLAVPMKKLHPRFQESEDEDEWSEGKIVFTSDPESGEAPEEPTDPRWDALKKLNNL